jgi:hypothetical protein
MKTEANTERRGLRATFEEIGRIVVEATGTDRGHGLWEGSDVLSMPEDLADRAHLIRAFLRGKAKKTEPAARATAAAGKEAT